MPSFVSAEKLKKLENQKKPVGESDIRKISYDLWEMGFSEDSNTNWFSSERICNEINERSVGYEIEGFYWKWIISNSPLWRELPNHLRYYIDKYIESHTKSKKYFYCGDYCGSPTCYCTYFSKVMHDNYFLFPKMIYYN